MNILLIFLLKIISDSSMAFAEDSDTEILCQFMGRSSGTNYDFNLADVHECCGSIVYAYYFLDGDWNGDYHVVPMDRDPIKTLVNAGKNVYVMVGFMETENWSNVFYPPNKEQFYMLIDQLKTFLTDFNVKGFILDKPKIYIDQPDLDERINVFVSGFKAYYNGDLTIGIVIDGTWYKNFTDDNLFSFAITNKSMDLYLIDTTKANICNQETKKTGVVPIISQDSNLISMEQMLTAAKCSSMDPSKLYAILDLSVRGAVSFGSVLPPLSRSEYCCREDKSQYCADVSTMLYEKGRYARQLKYKGIMLSAFELDDSENSCLCEKFPATTRIIGGWENKPVEPPCPNLDQL